MREGLEGRLSQEEMGREETAIKMKEMKLEKFAAEIDKEGPIKPKQWRRLDRAWSSEDLEAQEIAGDLLIKGLESPYCGTISESLRRLGGLAEFEEPGFDSLKEQAVKKLVEVSDPGRELVDKYSKANVEYFAKVDPIFDYNAPQETLRLKTSSLDHAYHLAHSTDNPELLEEVYRGCLEAIQKRMGNEMSYGESNVYRTLVKVAEDSPDKAEEILKILVERGKPFQSLNTHERIMCTDLAGAMDKLGSKVKDQELIKEAADVKRHLEKLIEWRGKQDVDRSAARADREARRARQGSRYSNF